MEKAKAAVSEFVGRHGKHDTTVDERQSPAVQHEEIKPVHHENITTAVDREVHQDHHHTTVQPVKDREILPEKHSHQMAGVQHKEFEHAKPQEVKARLDQEAQQFRDTSTTHNTKHTQAAAPTVEGEHVHHHVHENVQPVIEKETIAPSVVHTTVPIHETHHAAPEHHGVSVLPTKTMADFKGSGHGLTGSSGIVNQDQYEGCPRPYNSELQTGRTEADGNPHVHTSGIGSHHGSTTAGPHDSNLMNKADPRVDSDRDGRGLGGGTGMTGTGMTGTGMTGTHGSHNTAGPHSSDTSNKLDPRVDSDRSSAGHHTGAGSHLGTHSGGTDSTPLPTGHTTSHASGVSNTASHKKPSLVDRLNPMKDSDGDGKKGFMK